MSSPPDQSPSKQSETVEIAYDVTQELVADVDEKVQDGLYLALYNEDEMTPADFSVSLPRIIALQGPWEIALVQLSCSNLLRYLQTKEPLFIRRNFFTDTTDETRNVYGAYLSIDPSTFTTLYG